MDFQDLLA